MTDIIAQQFIKLYISENPFSKYSLYDENCISSERPINGEHYEIHGLDNIKQKSINFYKSLGEILDKKVSSPVVGDHGFSLVISLTYKDLNTGEIKTINELCVFIIKDGKIIREEFLY